MKEVWRRLLFVIINVGCCMAFSCLVRVLKFLLFVLRIQIYIAAVGGFTRLFQIRTVYAKQFRVVHLLLIYRSF